MKLNYKQLGEGFPVIIVHGLLGSLDNWITLGKRMADEGFSVYLIDQRNHGKSPHDDVFNYEAMSEDLKTFMDDHNIKKAHIIGHSMGGKTVMKFATAHENMIEKLIVVDITPKYYPPHHETILKSLKAVDFDRVDNRKDVEHIMKDYIKDSGVLQFLLKNLERADKNSFKWKMNLDVIADQIDNVGEALKKDETSDLPVLFMSGKNSDYISADDKGLLKSHFPNSTLITLKNAGHWIHVEQPDVFLKTTMHFLNA